MNTVVYTTEIGMAPTGKVHRVSFGSERSACSQRVNGGWELPLYLARIRSISESKFCRKCFSGHFTLVEATDIHLEEE